MKVSRCNYMRIVIVVELIGLLSVVFWGCTNVQHQVKLDKNYIPKEDVSIKVANVVNDTGFTFDIDIEQMLVAALEEQLMEKNLLSSGKEQPNLFMESRIIGYKKGSAFKRWMMPGWGATELSIRCELKDGQNNLVGTAIANREVVAGGGYTIGAWKTVFNDVANDVAEDLKDQIEAQGYVVKPKAQPRATTDGKNIEQSATATDQTQEKTKLASIPKDATVVRVSLRRQPAEISDQAEITGMLLKYGFFEHSRNADGSFANDFVYNNDGTLTDKATGLMWQCVIHRHRFNYMIWNVSYEGRNKSTSQMDKTLSDDWKCRLGLSPLRNIATHPPEMVQTIQRIRH